MGGRNLDLTKDSEILNIKSPRVSVSGPYKVVAKDIDNRWAIVALNWDSSPRLGMRWFYKTKGNPISTGHPTWFIIPNEIAIDILRNKDISDELKKNVEKFLNGEITGDELAEIK